MEYKKLIFNFFIDELEVAEAKIKEIFWKFIHWIINSDYENISKFFYKTKFVKNSGQAYLQEMQVGEQDKRIIFEIGYSHALYDFMQVYIESVSKEKEIEKVKTKYRNDILKILMKQKIMFHKDLAQELGVSPSGLNAIIKQMNTSEVKLIEVEEVSKYKLYSLTPIAHQYCVKYIEKISSHKQEVKLKSEDIQINYIWIEEKEANFNTYQLYRMRKYYTYFNNLSKIEKVKSESAGPYRVYNSKITKKNGNNQTILKFPDNKIYERKRG